MSSDDSLALALKLQAEEDAKLAQQEHDEGVAEAHDPWKQAEAEWGRVEANQYAEHDAKLAAQLQAQEQRNVQPAKKS